MGCTQSKYMTSVSRPKISYVFQISTTPLLSTSCKDCSSFRSNCCIGKMKVESSTNIPFFHRNEDSKHYRNVVKTTDTTHLENLFQKTVFSTLFHQNEDSKPYRKNCIAFFFKAVLLFFSNSMNRNKNITQFIN